MQSLSLESRVREYNNHTGPDNWKDVQHFTPKALIKISIAGERKYSQSLRGLICPEAPPRVLSVTEDVLCIQIMDHKDMCKVSWFQGSQDTSLLRGL